MRFIRNLRFVAVFAFFVMATPLIHAQGVGNSASITGTVLDPTGAVVPKATVEIHNVVSGLDRSTTTDSMGNFSFVNVPYNPYHLSVEATGFSPYSQDVDVRSSVTTNVKVNLTLAGQVSEVIVEATGGDLIETESTAHTDVDRDLFDKLPLESASSSLSSLVTLATPGVAADSNGLFHGLGDHAENSFSVDGQPITDQQSKVFSNQVPVDAIESMEVIQGAPPAEYGGKTSLVIDVTTRSGQGVTTPHGSVTTSYGSFGTANVGFNLAYGGPKWGNFISANGLNTGRFLDPPEFVVIHDKGNEENVFDRVDFQISGADSLHLNFLYTRSWFQNPNSYDQQFHPCAVGAVTATGAADCNPSGSVIVNPVTGTPLGATDQRSQIKTFNIAPTWTHLFGSAAVLTIGGFVRRDHYNYYPSADPFADFSPDLQSATIAQDRLLTNAGARASISYVKGIHNFKAGVTYEQTFLTEDDHLGVVDPGYVATIGNACAAVNDPTCSAASKFDLTNTDPATGDPAGNLYHFHGHTDIKEVGLFAQDTLTKGSWSFNLGIRGDIYRGISHSTQAEPRVGIAYNIKPTNTVLKVSYARTMESPFNENLVIASTGCSFSGANANYPVIAELVPLPSTVCGQGNDGPITPGFRNEFHAGIQQAFGKHLVIDAEYIWKYTHNGYDFGIIAATPIAFPIMWQRSKIPGYTIRANVPDWHGFTAVVVMSSVAARFFLPQVAGVPVIGPATSVFRIDHDEKFNETTHLQYQPWKTGPWFGFNWRYDSGLVSGALPCFASTATCAATTLAGGLVGLNNGITALPLTADQVFQAGLTCNGTLIAPNPLATAAANPLSPCPANAFGSIYLKVPAPNTENDDHNPQRIAPRHLFDLAVGEDNLFHGDRYKWSARVTVINVANKVALYNFLSTFSGTHYITPRTVTGELGFHF
ncbi:MAG TPA: TonB-dependent receptor [Verrucomicrobiae bacterium]|nr:TonB-dependent receptor [Verrucomicrobiae bacterium]